MRKENDLVLSILGNQDFSVSDFKAVGLTADNTSIETEDAYKNHSAIKNNPMFQTADGSFDDTKFHNFYIGALAYYNKIADDAYTEDLVKLTSYHRDNIFAPAEQRRLGPDFDFIKFPNPDRETSLIRLGTFTESDKSNDEIAESLLVLTNPVAVSKGAKPIYDEAPDTGIFSSNYWRNFWKTRVKAQYDTAGTHIDPITGAEVEHRKGDLKLNENGTYYYEDLDGRDVYGRLVLNKLNIITPEDSKWNDYDFFDSDDKKLKSVFGTLMKNLALVGSMYIPYVGPAIAGISVATQAAGMFATFGKMLSGSDNPTLSAVEGWSKSVARSGSSTEEALKNPWCWENFIGLIGDSIGLIKETRFLFETAPAIFKGTAGLTEKGISAMREGLLKEALENTQKSVAKFVAENEGKVSQGKIIKAFKDMSAVNQMKALAQVDKYVDEYNKIGETLSKTYMLALTVGDTYGEAKAQGASDLEATMLTLGYGAAEAKLLNTGLGEWLFPELRYNKLHLEAIAKALTSVKKESQEVARNIAKQSLKRGENEVKKDYAKRLFNIGRDTCRDLWTASKSTGLRTIENAAANAAGEGFEEVSEELLADLSKSCFNVVNYLRGDDTRMDSFDTDWKEGTPTNWGSMFDRYAMNFLGGFFGGGIAGLDIKQVRAMHDLDHIEFNQAMQELIYMGRNGKLKEFEKSLDKMDLGYKNLSTRYNTSDDGQIVWEPAQNDQDSLDYAAKRAIKALIGLINNILEGNGVKISDDSFLKGLTDVIKDLKYNFLLLSKTAGRFLLEFNSTCADIIDLTTRINGGTLDEEKTDAEKRDKDGKVIKESKSEKIANAEKLLTEKLKEQLKEALKKKDAMLDGSRSGEFILDALFEMTPLISDTFVKPSFLRFAESQAHKNYEDIPDKELALYKERYDSWEKTDMAELIHMASQVFSDILANSSPIIAKHAEEYKQTAQDDVVGKINEFFAKGNESYITKNIIANYGILELQNPTSWLQLAGNALKDSYSVFGDFFIKTFTPKTKELEQLYKRLQIVKTDEERKELENDFGKLINETLINNVDTIVDPYLRQGFINSEVRLLLSNILSEAKRQTQSQINILGNKSLELLSMTKGPGSKSRSKEEIQSLIDLSDELLNQCKELKKQSDNIVAKKLKLDSLQHTPIEKNLNEFALSTLGHEVNVTEILAKVHNDLLERKEDLAQFSMEPETLDLINEALWVMDAYKSTIEAMKTDNGDADNLFGYVHTINLANQNAKTEGFTPYTEIDTDFGNILILDLTNLKNKLDFAKKVYSINQGLKITKLKRVSLNKDYLFFNKVLTFRATLPDELKDIDKFDSALSKLEALKKYSGSDPSTKKDLKIDDTIRRLISTETILLEDAVYDLFQANKDLLSDHNVLKSIINPDSLLLYENPQDLLNEDSETIDDNSFIWWLATRAAVKSSDFNKRYAEIIDLDPESGKPMAPIPTQELAIYTNYASIVNGNVFDSFYKATRQAIKDDWKKKSPDKKLEILKKLNGGSVNGLEASKYDDYALSLIPTLKYKNIVFTEGIPGSGKTTGVYQGTIKMLQKFHPGDKILDDVVIVHGANKESADNLIDSLGLDKEHTRSLSKEDFMKSISSSWKPLTKVNGKYQVLDVVLSEDGDIRSSHKINETSNPPSLILMDEITNFTLFDLDDIDKFADKYGISVLTAGDTDQSGIEGEYGVNIPGVFESHVDKKTGELKGNTSKLQLYSCNFIRTPKLGVSMRTANLLKTKNLTDVQLWIHNPSNSIQLRYCENENGLFGDKVIKLASPNTDEDAINYDLKDTIDRMISTANGKIGYVYNESSSDNALKTLLESPEYKDKIDFYPGTSAQGKEGLYFIIDIDNQVEYEEGTDEDVANKFLHDLYTGITRSEQGSLIIMHEDSEPSKTGDLYCPSVSNVDIFNNLDSIEEKSTLLEQTDPKIIRKYASDRKIALLEDTTSGKDIVYKKRNLSKTAKNPEKSKPEEKKIPEGSDQNIPPALSSTEGINIEPHTEGGGTDVIPSEDISINWSEKIDNFKNTIGDIGTKVKNNVTGEIFTVLLMTPSIIDDKLVINLLSEDGRTSLNTSEETIGIDDTSKYKVVPNVEEEPVEFPSFSSEEMPENFLLNVEQLQDKDDEGIDYVWNFDRFKPSQSWWEKYLKIPYNDKATVVLFYYSNGKYGVLIDPEPGNYDKDYERYLLNDSIEDFTNGQIVYNPSIDVLKLEEPSIPEDDTFDTLPEEEAKELVTELTVEHTLPIKPEVNVTEEAMDMEILFDTALANETGVELEPDLNGKPVQTGNEETNLARIDSVNGLINLDKANGKDIRSLDDYLDILAKINSIIITESDPGKINEKLTKIISKEFGLLSVNHIFGFRSLPNTGTSTGDFAIYNRNYDKERIQGVFGDAEHNGEIQSKTIVCTIGSEGLGDILEIPVCSINNPISVLLMKKDGNYVFDEIISFYDFNSNKPENEKCDSFIKKLKKENLYNKYSKLAKLFELYKVTSSIYIPFNFKDLNDIPWTFAKDMKSLGPRMVALSKAQLLDKGGVYVQEGFSNDPVFTSILTLANANKSIKITPLLYAKRNTITDSNGRAIMINGDTDLLHTGHAFVLYTYADDVDDLYNRFIEELEDEALPIDERKLTKKVNIAYVLPPSESVEKYIDILHTIQITKSSSRPAIDNLGNSFTAYKLVKALWNSPEFLEKLKGYKEDFIQAVADRILLCDNAIDGLEGDEALDTLFSVLKSTTTLSTPINGLKSGVTIRQFFLHVLSELVYPTDSFKAQIHSNYKAKSYYKIKDNVDLITKVLADSGLDRVYYHLDKAKQERGHGLFYELNLEFTEQGKPTWQIKNVNGDSLDYSIHGNVTSPISIADPTNILDLVLGNIKETTKTGKGGKSYKMYVYQLGKEWLGQKYIHHEVTGKKQQTSTIETKTQQQQNAINLSKELHKLSPLFVEIEDIDNNNSVNWMIGRLNQLNLLKLPQCGLMIGDKYIIFDRSGKDLEGRIKFYDSKEAYDNGLDSNLLRLLDNNGMSLFFATIGDKEFDVIYDNNKNQLEFYSKGEVHPVWSVNESNITEVLTDLKRSKDVFTGLPMPNLLNLGSVGNLQEFYGTFSNLALDFTPEKMAAVLLRKVGLPLITIDAIVEYMKQVKEENNTKRDNCSINPITIKL